MGDLFSGCGRVFASGASLLLFAGITACGPAYVPPKAQSTDLALARYEQASLPIRRYERTLADETAMVARIKERLRPATQALCLQSGRAGCRFRVSIIDDTTTVNATASGTSRIDIYRGLIRSLSSEAELAFIVAHEMGHHIADHRGERKERSKLARTVGGVAFGIAGTLLGADIATVKRAITDGREFGGSLDLPIFSQQNEHEADYIGIYLIARAGYDPDAAASAIDRLSAMRRESARPAFFKSHPDNDDRAARLRRVAIEIDMKRRANQPLLPEFR